jgi:hypothetical protein
MDSRHPAPRIVKIRYRSGVNGRVAVTFAKIPYSGLFDLNEKLARLFSQGQIKWYRIDPASAAEIAEHRDTLTRWYEALSGTTGTTRINLEA